MNCRACRIEIEDAGLGQPLSERARAHAEACSPCRAFQEERLALRQLVGALETVTAPPDFDFRLRARLASVKSVGEHRAARRSFAPSHAAMALAASFALLVAMAVAFKQMTHIGTDAASRNEVAGTSPASDLKAQQVASVPTASSAPDANNVMAGLNRSQIGALMGSAIERRPVSSSIAYTERRFVGGRRGASSDSNNSSIMSADFVVYNAQPGVIQPGKLNPASEPNPLLALSLRTMTRPVKLLLDEGEGTMRCASLEMVTFGSQSLIKQDESSAPFTVAAEDVW